MEIIRDDNGAITSFSFRRPSNYHAHLRRDTLMRAIAVHIMRHHKYLLVMPNTGPILTIEQALQNHDELMHIAEEAALTIQLLMTLYHSKLTTPAVIERIAGSKILRAVKHYPPDPGVTTGSGHGIPLEESHEMLCAMQANRVPLLGHFESPRDKDGNLLDPIEGEAYMIREYIWRLRDKYPGLRICVEHASTREAIEFVKADTSGNTVMTVTPHHPLFNNTDFCEYGTFLKCKPIVQSPENQEAIRAFLISGDFRVIAGDDTAAHLESTKRVPFKDASNGCFFTGDSSIQMYAEVFYQMLALGSTTNAFEKVMSLNGPRFWGDPEPDVNDTILLERAWSHDAFQPINLTNDRVIPLGWDSDDRKCFRPTFQVVA